MPLPVEIHKVKDRDRRKLLLTRWWVDGEAGLPHWIEIKVPHRDALELINRLFEYLSNPEESKVVLPIGWCIVEDIKEKK